ncbi:hypothetical protein [Halobaculum sp. EA56]|uniref:hypothetical protein n=1 Tax=Halobaculum sp. EA56 TaxID=3421648 RepID=UPI003EC10AED
MSDRVAALEERVLAERELPAELRRDQRCLSDVLRRPGRNPLATGAAALILAVLGWQAVAAAIADGPLVGALVLATGAVAYLLARRLWAIQHRHLVRELARAGELDRLLDDGGDRE